VRNLVCEAEVEEVPDLAANDVSSWVAVSLFAVRGGARACVESPFS
jgi:hypothetical protein